LGVGIPETMVHGPSSFFPFTGHVMAVLVAGSLPKKKQMMILFS
jgi:hypothetical protein